MFVVFEGSDGSGKTTVLNMVCSWLTEIKKEFIATREPGGTDLGKKIRKILMEDDISNLSELALFFSDRAENIEKNVIPNKDKIVISDRHVDSTIAYQCYGRGLLNENTLRKINSIFTQNVSPDKIFVLDVSYEEAKNRMQQRVEQTKFDKMDREFFLKLQSYYCWLERLYPKYVYINTTRKTPEKVFDIVKQEFFKGVDQ